MNIIENICEYPECNKKAVGQVRMGNDVLICKDHCCSSQIAMSPSKLSQEGIGSVLSDLLKLKTNLNAMKAQISAASEKLVEKIVQVTLVKLQKLTEQEKKINKIISSVVGEGWVLNKVLKNIEENLHVEPLSEQNAIDSLLFILNDHFSENKGNKQQSSLRSFRQSIEFESARPSDIFDSRLLSRDTPITVKLDLLSWNQAYINQQTLIASQPNKTLKAHITILNSPTILQICPKSQLILTSNNSDTLSIWQFSNFLTPWKTLAFTEDKSKKIIDILLTKPDLAVITTQSSFYLINFKKLEVLKCYAHNDNYVQIFKVVSNKEIVFGTCSGNLSIFNVGEFCVGLSKNVHNPDGAGPFRALESCGKVVVAGGKDGFLKVLFVKGSLFRNLGAHAGEISAVTISRNYHFIASAGDDKYIILWNITTDNYSMFWKMKHSSIIINIQFSLDTTLILISTFKQISISDLSKFKPQAIKSSQLNIFSKFFPSISTCLNLLPDP